MRDRYGVISIRNFLEEYNRGSFLDVDHDTMIKAGWEEYYCQVEELPAKMKEIYKILSGITNDSILDGFYVLFYNQYYPYEDQFYLVDMVGFYPMCVDVDAVDRDNSFKYRECFFMEIDSPSSESKYCITSSRRAGDVEAYLNTEEDVGDFINKWEDMLRENESYHLL